MSEKPEYDRGYRDGLRFAVTWLHDRAKAMTDDHARLVLNSAATNLGWTQDKPVLRENGGNP